MRKTWRAAALVVAVGSVLAGTSAPAVSAPRTHTAPYESAVAVASPYKRTEIPVCTADQSGAVAARAVAMTHDGTSTLSQGSCAVGASIGTVHVPANRDWGWQNNPSANRYVRVSAVFHVESATVDVPPGNQSGSAAVFPCVEIGSARDCNWWWSDTDGVFTPMFGPFLPTGAHDEAHDETWSWGFTTGLPEGEYEVRAYLVAEVANGDRLIDGVSAEVVGSVQSITVDTSARI